MKTFCLLAVACAAILLSKPLSVLAMDATASLDDGRPILLAQATQKPMKAKGACTGTMCGHWTQATKKDDAKPPKKKSSQP